MRRFLLRFFSILFSGLCLTGYGGPAPTSASSTLSTEITAPVPKTVYPTVVASYPHDTRAYTQGLLFHDGKLYESIGQYGESAVRVTEPETGEELQYKKLPNLYFGEGLALVGDSLLYQLTWQEQRCLVHDLADLRQRAVFAYQGEGWGLAAGESSDSLYMSDGSAWVRVMNPADFTEYRRFRVTDNKGPVSFLNELEWIGGRLWANIYLTDRIAVIDPVTGFVTHYVDCSALETLIGRQLGTDVFNGIAHDPGTGRIWVTGKNWDKLFEITVEL